MIEKQLKDKYNNVLDDLDIKEDKTSLILTNIELKKDLRGKGHGPKIMKDMIKYADDNTLVIALTPHSFSIEKEIDRNSLVQFYKRFGFKMNKGPRYEYSKLKQYEMIRYPKIKESFILKTLDEFITEANVFPSFTKLADWNKNKMELTFPNEVKVRITYELIRNPDILKATNKSKPFNAINIHGIETPDKLQNKGLGSQVMKEVTSLADKKKIPLYLTAMPFKNKPLSKDDLVKFYKKLGFEIALYDESGVYPIMFRFPK